jgi:ADP-L-glycero-D-manno-heptose 6-epimerase
LAQQIKKGPPCLFGDGEQKRDYIFIDDVVRANLLAMEVNDTCVINIATGKATSFNQLVSILRITIPADVGVDTWSDPEYVPNPYKGAYQNHTRCDMTVAKEILDFTPKYDISRGIAEYYKRGEL